MKDTRRQISLSGFKAQYDFIVCGSGSSGSVVARQLADNPDVSVLLLEAGGGDDIPEVMEAGKWLMNLGSERDWSFQGQPNVNLNGRSVHFAMGKVLSGGSSINVMAWARPQERLGFLRITSCRELRHIPKGGPRLALMGLALEKCQIQKRSKSQ